MKFLFLLLFLATGCSSFYKSHQRNIASSEKNNRYLIKLSISEEKGKLHYLEFSNFTYDYLVACEKKDALITIHNGLAPIIEKHGKQFNIDVKVLSSYDTRDGVTTILRGEYYPKVAEINDIHFKVSTTGVCTMLKTYGE
jgi:hypothetical protein